MPGSLLAEVIRENQVEARPRLGFVLVVPQRIVTAPRLGHLLRRQAEQEEVFLAGLLGHFDGGAIAGADRQGTVHHEFHVAGAARLVARRGDLLRDVGRGNQPLSQSHAVIGQKNHLQFAPDSGSASIVAATLLMSLMMSLARLYAGAALPAKKNVRGGTCSLGLSLQAVVENDDVQHIEQLAFVFVDAFDLAVEDRIGIDGRPLTDCSQSAKMTLAARFASRKSARNAASSASGRGCAVGSDR